MKLLENVKVILFISKGILLITEYAQLSKNSQRNVCIYFMASWFGMNNIYRKFHFNLLYSSIPYFQLPHSSYIHRYLYLYFIPFNTEKYKRKFKFFPLSVVFSLAVISKNKFSMK